MKSKYIAFVTPKTYATLPLDKIPEQFRNDIEILPEALIYINQMDGWTAEECDDTCYIVEREYFENNNNIWIC